MRTGWLTIDLPPPPSPSSLSSPSFSPVFPLLRPLSSSLLPPILSLFKSTQQVILKALIVLHSMIRQGATDNVLGFLSGTSGQDVLRIKDSVGGGNWEGYSATKTLQTYAIYLEARITAYKNLRHDPIRVQSENNSNRMSMAGGAGTGGGAGGSAGGRARKLNSLTVDKGLLREVREVQKIVGCLIQCRVSFGGASFLCS